MHDLRRGIIMLTYGLLTYQFITDESQSIFVYLIALLLELLLLVIFYSVANVYTKNKRKVKLGNVLIGVIPLLLFHYVIIYFSSLHFDAVPIRDIDTRYTLLKPLLFFKKEIALVSLGILMAYSTELWYFKRLHLHLKVIESSVIVQTLRLWILGALSIIVLLLVPAEYQAMGITILPISRIVMEVVVKLAKRSTNLPR